MENEMKASQSYMDFFLNNFKSKPVAINAVETIKGTCKSMCPDEEVKLRKKEHMVHSLEVVGSQQKLVKRYCRPAADTNLAVAHNLRPFHILQDTVHYLLFEVTKRTDASSLVIYNFVADRLRAVRQDMIIQALPPDQVVTLLEPMIRFHVYYGYLLCELPVSDYSPTLNQNFLVECLKTCLYSYDELERKNAAETHDISFLVSNMVQCSLEEKNQQLKKSRELIEALYVLTNLYDESPMWRFGRLSENVRHAQTVRRAYKLAAAALLGHYVTVTKAISHLCPLTFCALTLFLPTIQRHTLRVISVAYSSRGRSVPLSAVRAWLGAGGGEGEAGAGGGEADAARALLAHYGLAESGGQVACLRGSFRDDAPLLPPRKISAKHLEGKMNIDYILTYTPQDTSQ